MFENITSSYDLTDASIEIFIMLLGAFLLGFVFAWLIKPRRYVVQKVVSASAIAGATSYSASKKSKLKAQEESIDDIEEDDEIYFRKKEKKLKAPKDNLQMIEGVGPKIEKLLNKHGIRTYADVLTEEVSGLEDILLAGGPRYQVHSPTTWPDQARLAMEGKWSELEEYQSILNRGQE